MKQFSDLIFVKDDVLNLAVSSSADTSEMVGMKESIINLVNCWMTGGDVGTTGAAVVAAATAIAAPPALVARALALTVLVSSAMMLKSV